MLKDQEINFNGSQWRVKNIKDEFTQAFLVLNNGELSKKRSILIFQDGTIERREARTLLEQHRYDYETLPRDEPLKIVEEALDRNEKKNNHTRKMIGTEEGTELRKWRTKRNNARTAIRKSWKHRKNKDKRTIIKKHIGTLRECHEKFFKKQLPHNLITIILSVLHVRD